MDLKQACACEQRGEHTQVQEGCASPQLCRGHTVDPRPGCFPVSWHKCWGLKEGVSEPLYPSRSWRVALELKTLEKRLQPEECNLKLLSQVPPQPFTGGEDRSSAAWPCWSWLTQLLKHISFSPGSP